ncbi:MAG: hypothetical protein ACYCYE_07875 [Clostridia bacterium]
MVKYNRIAKVCLLSFILAFLFLNVLGCVDGDKEAAESNKKIDKASDVKTNDAVLSKEENQKELKRLEELEAKLLEQSKEIEEKIKELQQKVN